LQPASQSESRKLLRLLKAHLANDISAVNTTPATPVISTFKVRN
jgi:hypothetical protein